MSWVFLTPRDAYKLKKPVRFPYLDFATLAARRHYCRAELRLNRRLAPAVYLGLRRLALGQDGRLRVDGTGRTVDWLVHMRRLPAARSLERKIKTGRVRPDEARAAADVLAAFFAARRPAPVRPAVYVGHFVREVKATRTDLLRPRYGAEPATVERTVDALLKFLDRRSAILRRRVAMGRIVEGHGDLRPEHVYLIDPPAVIDCLEFDRRLRILDPADELAYLAMECDRLGAPAVGRAILGHALARLGDRPPVSLVAFYKAYRALLRARIAAWHLDDQSVRSPAKWRRRTRTYLRLAAGYAARMR